MTVSPVLPPTAHPVAVAFGQILDEVSSKFFERRNVIEGVLLAILSKEHAFILGPPGTGKSALCREVFSRITGATYFEALLSKSRPAEAILGPVDIPRLRDDGDMIRKYEGYLPTANFAMLDEVGKMSPTLGHDLLSVVLERRLHQVDPLTKQSWVNVPLYSFIGGSNELPTTESDDAAAAWDRMLVRLTVDYIQESGNFAAMLTSDLSSTGLETTVDFKDLQDAVDNVVPSIPIPVDVQEAVLRLKDTLRTEDIFPSDRRWKQSMKLLKASAFLQGRAQVEEDDVQVLRHSLWDTPSQIQKVERASLAVANPAAEAAMALLDDLEAISKGIRDLHGASVEKRAAYGAEANGKLKLILSDLQAKKQESLQAGRSVTRLEEVQDRHDAVKRSVYLDLLDMDPSVLR